MAIAGEGVVASRAAASFLELVVMAIAGEGVVASRAAASFLDPGADTAPAC